MTNTTLGITLEKSAIAPAPEILSAMLSASADVAQLKADASGYISENYGVDLSTTDIKVAENTPTETHLALPFYDGLEEASAQAISDIDVSGGDISATMVTMLVLGVVGGLAGIAALAGGGVAFGVQENQQDK